MRIAEWGVNLPLVARQTGPVDYRSSNASGTFVADRHSTLFDNNRHFHLTTGVLEHLLQL